MSYVCAECGARQAKWAGSCAACSAWNTLAEEAKKPNTRAEKAKKGRKAAAESLLAEAAPHVRVPTGLAEFDRALGGGLVRGSIVLLGGAPGIGKSTLLLQTASALAAQGDLVYVSGEESRLQVAERAQRLGVTATFPFVADTDVGAILTYLEEERPAFAIIDSVQTLAREDLPGAPGSVQQIRESTELVRTLAKRLGITVLLVGHITKEGSIAGPKMLEHMVDVVLTLEGDDRSGYRLLKCSKNRFGPTNHLGVFELGPKGMADVADPALLFLDADIPRAPGIALAAVMEGQRLFVTEIQALVAPSRLSFPRRVITGLSEKRVEQLIAVLERNAGIALSGSDVFVSVVGGMTPTDPAIGLPVALALASSATGKTLPKDLIAFGEVGLLGEVRPATHAVSREKELARLGFTHVLRAREKTPTTLKEILAEVLA